MPRVAWFTLLLGLALGASLAQAAGEVIARVGEEVIDADALREQARQRMPTDGQPLDAAQKRELLDLLIADELLLQSARERDLCSDPKVEKVMINLLLREEVYSGVRNNDFSDGELRAYFEAHPQDFVVPAKRQIKLITVRVGEGRSEEQARALLDELRSQVAKDPESFAELAEANSQDPYARRGGDLGFVPREGKPGVDPKVVEVAFNLSEGELSKPFRGESAWHLVLVANEREEVQRSFDQMKGSVLRRVKNEAYRERYDAYIDRLMAENPVQVDEGALLALDLVGRTGLPMEGQELE